MEHGSWNGSGRGSYLKDTEYMLYLLKYFTHNSSCIEVIFSSLFSRFYAKMYEVGKRRQSFVTIELKPY